MARTPKKPTKPVETRSKKPAVLRPKSGPINPVAHNLPPGGKPKPKTPPVKTTRGKRKMTSAPGGTGDPRDGGPPPDPNVIVLSDNERLFVDEYLVDRNATQAYRRLVPNVGYDTARRSGSRMRCLPHVSAEIDAAIRAQRLRTRCTADNVITELSRVAFSDVLELFDPQTQQLRTPRHVPYEMRRAISSVRVQRARTTVRTSGTSQTTISDTIMEYKLWPKVDALAKLGRHLGLDTEITPLDALLRALPPELSNAVRSALNESQTATAKP